MDTLATTLDSFLADLQRRKFRPNTIKSYRADLRVAAQHLVAPLATLGLEDIEAFLGSEQRAPATTARRAATLRRFFAWAVRQHLCERNPLVDREPQRASTRRLPRPIDVRRVLRGQRSGRRPFRRIAAGAPAASRGGSGPRRDGRRVRRRSA